MKLRYSGKYALALISGNNSSVIPIISELHLVKDSSPWKTIAPPLRKLYQKNLSEIRCQVLMLKTSFLRRTHYFGNSKNTRKIVTYVLISVTVMSVLLLPNLSSGATIGGALNPQYISCSRNPKVQYSGHIEDHQGTMVGTYVLFFFSPQPYIGGSQTYVTTNNKGNWSTTLISCYYEAKVWWNSSSDGPYLTQETGVPASGSTYKVNVWETSENINLTYEFLPKSGYANISISYTTTTEVSINAYAKGSISDGFLSLNAADKVGTTMQVTKGVKMGGDKSFVIQKPAGTMITVEAANGSVLAYFEPYIVSHPGTDQPQEFMTPSQAWNIINATDPGYYPFQKLAPGTYYSNTTTYSTTEALSVNLSMTYGLPIAGDYATFGIEVGVQKGSSQTVNWRTSVPNNATEDYCYFIYQGNNTDGGFGTSFGPVMHIWLYKQVPIGQSCPA